MRFKSEKGQSMVEFALVLPILLVILCGIIDFGWLYSCKIASTNAAREAARYTAIHLYDSSTDNDQLIAYNIANTEAPQINLQTSDLTLQSLDLSATPDGIQESIKITVTIQVPLLTGITSTILGKDAITLSASSIMKIEN